ncbi:MAG: EfeM/EfeO family lipoprotein [Snodgrassella sp.]|nr:EfeM/EfeO family lipoprotein [Snodgrassella sp.]
MLHRKLSFMVFCLLFFPLLLPAHGLRAPIINDSNVVPAKGDIPTPSKYLPAIRAYQHEVVQQLKTSQQYVDNIAKAAKAGQLQTAEQNYILAHQSYEQVRTIIRLFANADETINSRADYYLEGVNDPAFVGFHRLEYDLFVHKNLTEAHTQAVDLHYKLGDLHKRVANDELDIAKIIQSAADFTEMILTTKLMGQENQYSHSDLADIQANIQGSAQILRHLTPFIPAKQYSSINQGYQQMLNILNKYQLSQGQYQTFDQLRQKDHDRLYSLISTQAQQLAELRSQLGIQVYHKYKH